MEEVVVTAQRVSQNIQNVPIAVTALTGKTLIAKQITGASDLQMNSPNVSFTATNFGSSSYHIRAISAVSNNINQVPVIGNQNAIEYYDVKRVEILRGPQGTLFGRTATGGAVNVVTNMPDFDGVSGNINAEYGNYNAARYKGALNIPITSDFAVRIAGLKLNRHGFITNSAYGQTNVTPGANFGKTLPNIGSNLDGRNLWAFRFSAKWNISDNANGWIIYSRFHENDDRVRVSNQVCKTNPIPTTGCLPNEFGFQHPNFGTTTGGIFGGLNGAVPMGSSGAGDASYTGFPDMHYDYPQPKNVGYRVMHTDFQPVFQDTEKTFMTGWNYDFTNYHIGFLGAYQTLSYLSQQDYLMDVGPTFQPTAANPTGYWPTSRPAGGAGAGFSGSSCNWLNGTAGVAGGCIYPADTSREFSYDQSDSRQKTWTTELKIRSSLPGPFNFTAGINSYYYRSSGDYYVLSNGLDLVTTYGVAALQFPPLYPGIYDATGAPDGSYLSKGYAGFGEIYYNFTPSLKLTIGGRFNKDSQEVRQIGLLYNATNLNYVAGEIGAPPLSSKPVWSRVPYFAAGFDLPIFPASLHGLSTGNLPVANHYASPSQVAAALATAPFSPERMAISGAVPIIPEANETRDLTGSPHDVTFRRFTGRIGLNWQVNNNSMLYAFLSRGYKPGGFNSAVNPAFQGTTAFTFKPEGINAFEVGSKNMLLDNTLMLNGDVFYYNYQALQISQIVHNASVTANTNARIFGAELEAHWQPSMVPNLSLDFAYSYLHARIRGVESVDPVNRTAGNPDWILLEDIDPGSLTGVNFVANKTQISQAVVNAGLASGGMLSAANGKTVPGTAYTAAQTGTIAIPAYVSRNFLDASGVATSDGLPTNLEGKELPDSPSNTVHLGIAYTWDIAPIAGNITARWDYYWQDKSYAREFNSIGDRIDSWYQNNASVTYNSTDGHWMVKAWIRNINNNDNVTGKYLTSDTSGFYRNYFLTEPRLFGGTLSYSFGS